jgi:hypothetical protein
VKPASLRILLIIGLVTLVVVAVVILCPSFVGSPFA